MSFKAATCPHFPNALIHNNGVIFDIGCRHGYLFARATAWCYVHGLILKSPLSRRVCTVAGANVVQLCKVQRSQVQNSTEY